MPLNIFKFLFIYLNIWISNYKEVRCQNSFEEKLFTLRDNTVAGIEVGNINNSTFRYLDPMFGTSNFGRLNDYFTIDKDGTIRTRIDIDRDNRDDICGPLSCCLVPNCRIVMDVHSTSAVSMTTLKVVIIIKDENDIAPKFAVREYTVNIPENKSNFRARLPQAADMDSNLHDIQFYTVSDNQGRFKVETINGQPWLVAMKTFDYESQEDREYRLQLVAHDKGKKSGQIPLTIKITDINDNPPVMPFESKEFTIPENTRLGTVVTRIRAFDLDDGENKKLKYKFGPNYQPRSALQKFSINENTGEIRVIGSLDYESYAENSFTLPVLAVDQAVDSHRLTSTCTLTMKLSDVNDNHPVLKINENKTIEENSAVGQIALRVHISDYDKVSNGKIDCTEKSSQGLALQKKTRSAFFIKTTKSFDHEIQPLLSLTVVCTDNAEPQLNITQELFVKIKDLNDNYPIFYPSGETIKVLENQPIGRILHSVNASDKDGGSFGALSFEMDDEGRKWFKINEKTGVISIDKNLDRETVDKISFIVTARDGGGKSASATYIVEVGDENDNFPKMTSSSKLSLPENSAPGTPLTQLKFEDPDLGPEGEISIHLDRSNPGMNRFVKLLPNHTLVTRMAIDREDYAHLLITIIATDNGRRQKLTSTSSIRIQILDLNDNAPHLSSHQSDSIIGYDPGIYTNTQRFTKVAQLHGIDPDYQENGTILYSLRPSNSSGLFIVNASSGQLFTNWKTTRPPKADIYAVILELSDKGRPPRKNQTLFHVKISPAGDNPSTRIGQATTAAISNFVILILIVVFSIALAAALIAAIVWAKSKSTYPSGSNYDDDSNHGAKSMAAAATLPMLDSNGYPDMNDSQNFLFKSPPTPNSEQSYTFSPSKTEEPMKLGTFGSACTNTCPNNYPMDQSYLGQNIKSGSQTIGRYKNGPGGAVYNFLPTSNPAPSHLMQNSYQMAPLCLSRMTAEPNYLTIHSSVGVPTSVMGQPPPTNPACNTLQICNGISTRRYSDHSFADSGQGGSIDDVLASQRCPLNSSNGTFLSPAATSCVQTSNHPVYLPKHAATLMRTPEESAMNSS